MKPAELQDVAEVCHMLADPTRVTMVAILARGPKPVMALCDTLKRPPPIVSHHLALLRMSGLVSQERKGKQRFYSLNRGNLDSARAFLAKLK
jgi:ArsR family transcriptional regulator